MNNTSKSAVILLAGIAAGVTLGVLFAPKKGTENRQKIATSLLGLRDAAADQIDLFLNMTDNLIIALKTNRDMYASQHDDIENAII